VITESYSPSFAANARSTKSAGNLVVAAPVGALAALLVYAIFQPDMNQDGLAVMLLLASIAFLAGQMTFSVRSREERPSELFYITYMLFYYIIPGLLHVSIRRFPFFDLAYPSWQIVDGASVVLPFVLAVAVGYSFRVRLNVRPWELRPGMLPLMTWAVSLGALAAAWMVGLQYFQFTRGEQNEYWDILASPMTAALIAIARSSSFLAVLFGLILVRRKVSFESLITLALALVVFGIITNPLAIPRSIIASYAFATLIVFRPLTRKLKAVVLGVLVVGQFTIFPMLSLLQRGDIGSYNVSSARAFLERNGDFDGLQSTINVVNYAQVAGFKWGGNMLSAVFSFVPRSIWPSKSYGAGQEAATMMGYRYTNVSSPLPSELFLDFGFLGVIAGGILFGFLLRYWDVLVVEQRRMGNTLLIVPFACVISWIFVVLRGSLVGVLGPMILTFGIALLTARLATRPGGTA
jgi:hypothetical protein